MEKVRVENGNNFQNILVTNNVLSLDLLKDSIDVVISVIIIETGLQHKLTQKALHHYVMIILV